MTGIVCAIVGNSVVTAVAEVIRRKKGITANGNAQIDTAQSKFGGSSALFDGTGDYLLVNSDPSFAYGTGDYTIEFWVYNSAWGTEFIFDQRTTGTQIVPAIYYDAGVKVYVNGSDIITGGTLTTNTWHHIALVKSGSDHKLYYNGTQTGSTYSYNGTYVQGGNLTIGTRYAIDTSYSGWIDEIRISNTARYTANFTPSTTPFVNDNNTLLLLHCDGTDASTYFEDDNGIRSPIGVYIAGNAQIDTAQSKFGGSSALFDGTGDYLTCSTPTDAFNFGSGNFTIEFWLRLNANGATYVPIAGRYSGSIFNGQWWAELTPTNTFYWGFKTQDGANTFYPGNGGTATFSTGVWYHIAVVRNGNSMQMYRDGTAYGSAVTVSGSFGYTGDIWVGSLGPGGYAINGWVDEVRISKTARYTANFTAPTTPHINDANTVLLLHMDGTDGSTVFRDDNGTGRSQVGITAIGNAQIDTAQSKFGGSSALFDGSNDSLQGTLTTSIGTGEFTWECWLRFTDTDGGGIIDLGNVTLYLRSDEKLGFYDGNTATEPISASSTTLSTNTWYHIAATRQSSDNKIRIYLNGTLDGTSANTYTTSIGTSFKIGETVSNIDLLGHIDEVRISNTARYTANFTPATEPFSNDANTLLLLHMDGTDASTVFFDDNGQVPQTP